MMLIRNYRGVRLLMVTRTMAVLSLGRVATLKLTLSIRISESTSHKKSKSQKKRTAMPLTSQSRCSWCTPQTSRLKPSKLRTSTSHFSPSKAAPSTLKSNFPIRKGIDARKPRKLLIWKILIIRRTQNLIRLRN